MKSHQEIAAGIGELVAQKNLAYGDSLGMVGTILTLHFPHGIPLERYDDAFLLARIFDKTMRFAEANDPHGECPLTDIAGYASPVSTSSNARSTTRHGKAVPTARMHRTRHPRGIPILRRRLQARRQGRQSARAASQSRCRASPVLTGLRRPPPP